MKSFLEERTTTITINGNISKEQEIEAGIPQGSTISPILYLFFNAPLLEACSSTNLKAAIGGFVDDAHLLAFGDSTEENCGTLTKLHEKCLEYAKRHGASFAFDKYELIHFTRRTKGVNMGASIIIEGVEIKPKSDVRVLGLQLDCKLKWGANMAKIEKRMAKQALALQMITTSTWGATLKKARQIYTAVVRPAMTYAAPIWHRSERKKGSAKKKKTGTLAKIQKSCLRTVTGAYKATSTAELEAEVYVIPIDIQLDIITLKAQKRGGSRSHTEKAREKVKRLCKGKRGKAKTLPLTPAQRREQWAKEIEDDVRTIDAQQPQNLSRKKEDWAAAWGARQWQERWKEKIRLQEESIFHPIRQGLISRKRLRIYDGLQKAEASLAIQMRTGKIGLAQFLYMRKVPGWESANCFCGGFQQTVKHILIFYPEFRSGRQDLWIQAGSRSYDEMLTTTRGVRAAARWLMKTNLLGQFSLAKQQLLGEKTEEEE